MTIVFIILAVIAAATLIYLSTLDGNYRVRRAQYKISGDGSLEQL